MTAVHIPNPFDFSNPVRSRQLLAGRDSEMGEATYYIDQARAGDSYSLALIGERATGKTSLLNALEEYAAETGVLSAHVRLDNSIVESELSFFREIFEALMEQAASRGLFGGLAGASYDTFLRQVTFLDLDTERATEPLAFGRIYATAKATGRPITLTRRALGNDFQVIVEAAQAASIPAVLVLVDEADLLSRSETLLQTLRNLLMGTPHLVFAMAGTDHMFPALTEVFSPVPRQFVRISVEPFRSWQDTHRAIRKRLVLSGADWALPRRPVARRIHDITRGQPYEVILVAHFAFRELTNRRERRAMTLSARVLEDVARQLEQQNPALRRAVDKIRDLDANQADVLARALELDGVSVERLGFAALAFDGTPDRDAVETASRPAREALATVDGTGLIRIDNGVIRITADPFERSYLQVSLGGRRNLVEDQYQTLSEPEAQLIWKVMGLIQEHGTFEGASEKDCPIIREIVAADLAESAPFGPLVFDDEIDAKKYTVRVDMTFGNGNPQVARWFLAAQISREVVRARVEARLEGIKDRLIAFDVPLPTLGVAEIARTDLEREIAESQPSPIDEPRSRAVEAFLAAQPGYEGVVRDAAIEALGGTVEEAKRRAYNDLAFMVLASGDDDLYRKLSDIAMGGDGGSAAITLLTRALWLATHERLDAALRLTDEAEMAEGLDEHEAYMYSPAVLARTPPVVTYEDLVAGVDLESIPSAYRGAIEARKARESVAEALAAIRMAPRWVILAAARAADFEGRGERAAELRALAAEMEVDE